jgi:SAM-dependent methyltransferase
MADKSEDVRAPRHHLPGLEPLSRDFGKERGTPIDRAYIHEFLWERRDDVRGRVLEVADSGYTDYLGEGAVTHCDVLHVQAGLPWVTLVGDLATGEGIPRAVFDCIVLTQTLHLIYDVRNAIRTTHDALKPGGVVLATLPGISQLSQFDRREWGDFWRFTADSARMLFSEVFGPGTVEVVPYGNVLVASAFLYGYALEDLSPAEIAHRDDDFHFLIGVRAMRSAAS